MKLNKQQYKEENCRYLNDNQSKPDMVCLPSGLQYRVIKMGEGIQPVPTSLVHVYYEGKFIDQRVFDTNLTEPFPALLRVFEVIDGWREALLLMKEGSEFEIVVPFELGYGKKKVDNIPGCSTLLFRIQLIKVE